MAPEVRAAHIERMSAAELLPLIYDELRRLATARLGREHAEPMQPTSLVHAAYLRVVGNAAQDARTWTGRGHFFGAAALAMRRILVERARQRNQLKKGRGWARVELSEEVGVASDEAVDMIALDGALEVLEREGEEMSRVVMLRYFAGLSVGETAGILGISPKTVKRRWAVARLWLLERIEGGDGGTERPDVAQ
jgi:RNA polymerase sigma factor (TIGR02999 family)